jgi:hypothetical protein
MFFLSKREMWRADTNRLPSQMLAERIMLWMYWENAMHEASKMTYLECLCTIMMHEKSMVSCGSAAHRTSQVLHLEQGSQHADVVDVVCCLYGMNHQQIHKNNDNHERQYDDT